jgi:predicted NAD/FAD-dependent oxidoreductase
MELTGRTVPMRLLAPVLGPAGGLLGAGLAALAAAHELMRRDYEVGVLEAQDCPGGRGQNCSRRTSAQRSYRDGRRADLDSHLRGIGWVDASAWPFGKVVQVKIRFAADAVWERLRP